MISFSLKITTKSSMVAVLSFLSIAIANLAVAADIPRAAPEEVGMSSDRLEQINIVMQRHIDAGDVQGAITVIARHGKLVHFETHGLMDVDNLSLIHI